jgi:nitrate/TMAO reductase-like tetraheme cytochrome c subunit
MPVGQDETHSQGGGRESARKLLEALAQIFRPLVYLSHNPISRTGVVLTSTSAVTLLLTYAYQLWGWYPNPYTGILIFLILPGVFVAGLALIPLGIYRDFRRQRHLGLLPATYPTVDFRDRRLRQTALFVAVMTAVNVPIFALASYRSTVYMDSVQFCGTTCHTVMQPEYTAYQRSPHARVPCVDCHIGPGASWFVRSKLSGSYQVLAVTFNLFPRPIPVPVRSLRPARATCEECHWPEKFSGDKLVVKTSFADDEKNSATQTVLLMHIGGRNWARQLVGIHGAHLGLVTYIAADEKRQKIPWVSHQDENGSVTEYVSADDPLKPDLVAHGERRLMDCMDCHNRPSHTFLTPEEAVNREMAAGRIRTSLPFARKVAVELLKRPYPSREAAQTELPEALRDYYRKNHFTLYNTQRTQIEQAARALLYIYEGNVFPDMHITWGSYPNNLGHTNFPGCFRCHDGNHKSKDSREITQDCNACHSLLAMDEPHPKILQELGETN